MTIFLIILFIIYMETVSTESLPGDFIGEVT